MTIVRAGYGLYYDQPLVGIFEQNAFINPPYVNTVSLQNPVAVEPGGGHGSRNGRAARADRDAASPFETPRTQQWNIGVQRQLYRARRHRRRATSARAATT